MSCLNNNYLTKNVLTFDSYSPIEPAFQTCGASSNVIPVALGPKSKAIGGCAQMRGDTGQCVGAFLSQHVDARDPPSGRMAINSMSSSTLAAPYVKPNTYSASPGPSVTPGTPGPSVTPGTPGPSVTPGTPGPSVTPGTPGPPGPPTPSAPSWGPCSSYGSYSSCPNCSLSCGMGNSVLGQSAQPWCVTKAQYIKPYPSNIHQPNHNLKR